MKRNLSIAIVSVAGLSGYFLSSIGVDRDQIIFLRVGQGDSTIIRSGGRVVLVDTGPTSDAIDAGERFVVPALRQGNGRLDLIILTHPDIDHVGGTGAVLKAYPNTPIVANAAFRTDAVFSRQLRDWNVESGQLHWIEKPATLTMGSTKVTLVPPPGDLGNDNAGSLLMKIFMNGKSAVITGDAPEATEAWAIGREKWTADLYKAGHHGSATSSTLPWLEEVSPKIAVISCGRANRYGHPAKEVTDRFEQLGIKIRRTDREGDICLQPDLTGWQPCR